MDSAKGEVIETPTQEMPFKAVITIEEGIIQERFFATRAEAETHIIDTQKGLAGITDEQPAYGVKTRD